MSSKQNGIADSKWTKREPENSSNKTFTIRNAYADFSSDPEDDTEAMRISRGKYFAGVGNELANAGKYSEAIERFNEAIQLDQSDHRFFGNRSFCLEKIGYYEKALEDADSVIKTGLFRRGRALFGLKRYEEAETAFHMIMELEPTCSEAADQISAIRTHLVMDRGFTKQEAESALKIAPFTVNSAIKFLTSRKPDKKKPGIGPPPGFSNESEDADEDIYYSDGDTDDSCISSNASGMNDYSSGYCATSATGSSASADVAKTPTQTEKRQQNENSTGAEKPLIRRSLYVGNINPNVSNEQLLALFSNYGQVQSMQRIVYRNSAFVHYVNGASAEKVLRILHGFEWMDRKLVINYAFRQCENRSSGQNGEGGSTQVTVSKIYTMAPATAIFQNDNQVLTGKCFFWRGSGCRTGSQCPFAHIAREKGIDLPH